MIANGVFFAAFVYSIFCLVTSTGSYITAKADTTGAKDCNGSGRCDATTHIHGCYSDLGHCDESADHGFDALDVAA